MRRAWLIVALAAFALSACGDDWRATVQYPHGYRDWTHVKSMVVHDDRHPLFDRFQGIHHVYVNWTGRSALRLGIGHPNGSVLVFDLLEANADAGSIHEGRRRLVAVMIKNSMAYRETGGWGFGAFAGDSPAKQIIADVKRECFSCHEQAKTNDYVFSAMRE